VNGLAECKGHSPVGARSLDDGDETGWRAVRDFHPPKEGRTLDSRIKSRLSVRPALGAGHRIWRGGHDALCEDESCGLARVTSDGGIVS